MISSDNKSHWENVYETKNPDQVSWTQKKPQTSLDFIRSSGLGKDASIIDIGGGDSNLVDFLLEEGYKNITVLDISAKALEKAQERLGESAHKVKWIATDITAFEPTETYDIWHDRAAFHFLTTPEQISKYIDIAEKSVKNCLILGTFSKTVLRNAADWIFSSMTKGHYQKNLKEVLKKFSVLQKIIPHPLRRFRISFSVVLKNSNY